MEAKAEVTVEVVGDAIAELRQAAATLRRSCNFAQPASILMHPEMLDRVTAAIDRAKARHEKRLRKPLLSGRYGKRRRQRAQGVARMRHMKREHSRRWLAMVKAATNA